MPVALLHANGSPEAKLLCRPAGVFSETLLFSVSRKSEGQFYRIVVALFPILRCVRYRAFGEVVANQPHEFITDRHLDVHILPSARGIDQSLCCRSTCAERTPDLRKGHIWFGSRL